MCRVTAIGINENSGSGHDIIIETIRCERMREWEIKTYTPNEVF